MYADRAQTWLFAGLTLVLAGYFLVWLPHEAAGLSYIGLEMGEQAKFLPQVRSGEVTSGRSLFYIPPVAVGVILALVSSRWPNGRWQTWVTRALAAGISFLAFPAFEAIGTEAEEWLWRVLMIGLVVVVAVAAPAVGRVADSVVWLLISLVALSGAVLPTWVFWEVRTAFAAVQQQSLGIGPGVWLNLAGHLIVVALAIWMARDTGVSNSSRARDARRV